MPVLRKSFRERSTVVLGVVGIAVIALVVAGALSASAVRRAVTETAYHARFGEAGGLREGDDVRVAGLRVGSVTDVTLKDRQVDVRFSLDDDVELGAATTAEIKSATVLGRKFLQLRPLDTPGQDPLAAGATIPIERTRTPFDVQSRLEGLTREVAPLDAEQLSTALDTVSASLADTPDEVRLALDGVRRAAATVTSRDDALLKLLQGASEVSGLLASRAGEVTTLVRDANGLLTELTLRREALRAVLVNVDALVAQVRGLAADNADRLGPALAELDGVTDLLRRNEGNIAALVEGLRNYVGSLGEAVNGGPWFYGYIANLVPSNMAQQTVDSLLGQLPQGGAR